MLSKIRCDMVIQELGAQVLSAGAWRCIFDFHSTNVSEINFLVLDYKDFDKQPRPSMSMTGFAMPGGECEFQTNQYGQFGGQGWQLFY